MLRCIGSLLCCDFARTSLASQLRAPLSVKNQSQPTFASVGPVLQFRSRMPHHGMNCSGLGDDMTKRSATRCRG
ncbi:hypothetical protein B0T18DRAFT_406033, partial [Schizothecium vesticola]